MNLPRIRLKKIVFGFESSQITVRILVSLLWDKGELLRAERSSVALECVCQDMPQTRQI